MEQKVYSVDVFNKDYYYVVAFSKEHAIAEVVNMLRNSGQKENPTDYSLEDVKHLTDEEMEDIVIDYNYITESYEKTSLKEFFEEIIEQENDIYGVVCDDFISYPESYDKTLLEIQKQLK